MSNIFISYSRDDSEFVLSLAKVLRESGVSIWLDQWDIPPGANWDDSVEQALRDCTSMLVIWSKSSVKSQNVKDEVGYAHSNDKTIIPVYLENCDIPFRWRRKQRIDFRRNPKKGVQDLIKTLKLDKATADKLNRNKGKISLKSKPKKFIGTISTVLVLLALFSLYQFVLKPAINQRSSQVTVLIHEETAKDKLVLPNRGQVKLIYGDANVVETINAKGEATFKQIPPEFFGEDATVEILFMDPEGEPYRAINPDSVYKITRGKYISLAVKLFGLDAISGIVTDFITGDPVEGVRVSISGIEAFTNKYGEYTLSIPVNKQQKFQTVRAFKEGYELFELNDIPVQTQQEVPIKIEPKSP